MGPPQSDGEPASNRPEYAARLAPRLGRFCDMVGRIDDKGRDPTAPSRAGAYFRAR